MRFRSRLCWGCGEATPALAGTDELLLFGAGDGVAVRNNGRRRRTRQISANRTRREKERKKGRRRERHGGKLRALYCTSNGRLQLSRLRQMLRKVREGASVMPLSENPILLYAMSLTPRSNHASRTDHLLSPRWTNLQSYCIIWLYFLNEATFSMTARCNSMVPCMLKGNVHFNMHKSRQKPE
ncbi:hypothetical protein BZA77DRAFT_299448 [Pyronema omphalodes]|nr:hypothetical protein BZA77DRAFT_299448 [Pyronema omphalodes]